MAIDIISDEQQSFYDKHKRALLDRYLRNFPKHIDPDAVRDLFIPIGYDRSNVLKYKGICKILTRDIYLEALKRNQGTVDKVIFAAGLPASGKSTHLKTIAANELVYDGTINNENKFLEFIQFALDAGYNVEVIVYSVDPKRAFKSNLDRGNISGRYVPISQYKKVAKSINNRQPLLKQNFQKRVIFRNFEHTLFEGKPKRFSKILINSDELKGIANDHEFPDSKTLQAVCG